jgi:endogenous inhibitor of DNA gyrase (YacG/DUF329 family)
MADDNHNHNRAPPTPRTPKCPICRKEPAAAYRPFCSKRCADVDLGRWVTGSYVIAGGDADSDEDGPQSGQENRQENGPGRSEKERSGE